MLAVARFANGSKKLNIFFEITVNRIKIIFRFQNQTTSLVKSLHPTHVTKKRKRNYKYKLWRKGRGVSGKVKKKERLGKQTKRSEWESKEKGVSGKVKKKEWESKEKGEELM